MNTDVVIVGSGVSGLILSILLKEKNVDHVVLNRVEKQKTLELPETIPPSALVLLEALNLLELFSKSSSKTFGYHSLWNSEVLTTDNFFDHNPYKYGLKLNKKQLLVDLGELVTDHTIPFDKLIEINRSDENFTLKVKSNNSVNVINGRVIVDATGRNRSILKHFGVTSKEFDDQVALSCQLPYFNPPQLMHQVYVESFENGWGIVSSLNKEMNGMTLYTKKGSPILPQLKDYRNWKAVLSNTKYLKDFLSDELDRKVVGGKANSSRASQIAGSNWLAIGDAAIAFDPVSSHGVSNAIYCANAASGAIQSRIKKDAIAPFKDYDDTLCQVFNAYLKQKSRLYDTENR